MKMKSGIYSEIKKGKKIKYELRKNGEEQMKEHKNKSLGFTTE